MPPTTARPPPKLGDACRISLLRSTLWNGPPVWPDSSGRPLMFGQQGGDGKNSPAVESAVPAIGEEPPTRIAGAGRPASPGVVLPGRDVYAEIVFGQHRYHEIGHERPRHALRLSGFACRGVRSVLGSRHQACSLPVPTSPPTESPEMGWWETGRERGPAPPGEEGRGRLEF
jgi:hypothetical protein